VKSPRFNLHLQCFFLCGSTRDCLRCRLLMTWWNTVVKNLLPAASLPIPHHQQQYQAVAGRPQSQQNAAGTWLQYQTETYGLRGSVVFTRTTCWISFLGWLRRDALITLVRCPYVRPSVHKKFFDEWCTTVCRMTKSKVKVTRPLKLEILRFSKYLLRHF